MNRTILVLWLLLASLSATAATASVWDELSESEKTIVLEKLKAELPKLLPADDDSAFTSALRALAKEDIGKLATLAGDVGGNPQGVADELFKRSEQVLVGAVKADLDKKVKALDSPVAQGAYDFLNKHPELTKTVARQLLNGKWQEAQALVFKTAESEARTWVKGTSEQALKGYYNWVFNDAKATIAGSVITPFDVFRYIVAAEVKAIPLLSQKLEREKLSSLFDRYVEYGHDWNALYASGGFGQGLGRSGGFGLWEDDLESLKPLFESCRGLDFDACYVEFKTAEDAKQAALDRAIQQKKAKAVALLRESSERNRRLLKERVARIQQERDRLARERNQDYQEALRKATEIAKQLDTAAGGIDAQCAAFDAAAATAQEQREKVIVANDAVDRVERAIQEREACSEIGDHTAGIDADMQGLRSLQSELGSHIAQVARLESEVCTERAKLVSPLARATGTAMLESMRTVGTQLVAAADQAERTMQRLREGKTDIDAIASEARRLLSSANQLSDDSKEAEQALSQVRAAEGAEDAYRAARVAMAQAAAKADALAGHIEQINPAEPGVFARLEALLEGGGERAKENTRLFNLLMPYRKDEKAKAILDKAKVQLDRVRSPACVRSWTALESQRWTDPNVPADLDSKMTAAERACSNLPDASEFDRRTADAKQLLTNAEADEFAVTIHRRDAETCLAQAVLAVNALPDVATELTSATDGLEAVCKDATDLARTLLASEPRVSKAADTLADGMANLEPSPEAKSALADCALLPAQQRILDTAAAATTTLATDARAGADQARSATLGCTQPGFDRADVLERNSRAEASQAVLAFGQAEVLERRISAAADAAALAAAKSRQQHKSLPSLDVFAGTLRSEINNAERDAASAKQKAAECASLQISLQQRWAAAGGASSERMRALGQRIAAVTAAVPDDTWLAAARSRGATLRESRKQVRTRLDQSIADLDACPNGADSYATFLGASRAVLLLDGVRAQLDGLGALRAQCGSAAAAPAPPDTAGSGGGYDPRTDRSGRPSSAGPVDLDGVDEATARGRAAARPGGSSGGEGQPVPLPAGDPLDTGFEAPTEPDNDPYDPRNRPIDPNDGDIVDLGTSGGSTPDTGGATGQGRSAGGGGRSGGSNSGADNPSGGTTGGNPSGGTGGGNTSGGSTGGDNTGGGQPAASCRDRQSDFNRLAQTWVADLQRAAAGDGDDCVVVNAHVAKLGELERLLKSIERDCGVRIPMDNLRQMRDQFAGMCDGDSGSNAGGDDDGQGLEFDPRYWGGGEPCGLCKEAFQVNCNNHDGNDEAFCSRYGQTCRPCPGNVDLSCRAVQRACVQNQMYLKSQNRPDWDLETLRRKALDNCPPCR